MGMRIPTSDTMSAVVAVITTGLVPLELVLVLVLDFFAALPSSRRLAKTPRAVTPKPTHIEKA